MVRVDARTATQGVVRHGRSTDLPVLLGAHITGTVDNIKVLFSIFFLVYR